MKLFEKKLAVDEFWRVNHLDSDEIEKLKSRFNSVCELLGIGFTTAARYETEKAEYIKKEKK